jgi:hypothetical protein
MTLFAIGMIAIAGILYLRQLHQSARSRKQARLALEEKERALLATYYYCDMGKLFLELMDDPFMTSAKWKELLPIFEDVDRHFAETHLDNKNFFRYAEAVRREIADLPMQEIGSP